VGVWERGLRAQVHHGGLGVPPHCVARARVRAPACPPGDEPGFAPRRAATAVTRAAAAATRTAAAATRTAAAATRTAAAATRAATRATAATRAATRATAATTRAATGAADGQGLAEFALILPILALIFAAVIQFALVFETQIGITNAVREAARRAAAIPTSSANVGTNGPWARSQLLALLPAVQQYAPASLLEAQVCYASVIDPGGTPRVEATVSVRYGHSIFIPLIDGILDGIDGTADHRADISTSVTIEVQQSTVGVSGCYS
jgi:Flp pilus assembly protein TadG